MSWQDSYELARRARAGRGVVFVLFGVLTLAFFRVQVVRSDRFRLQSESNRLRSVRLLAPRGLVTDRHGVVLVENVPGFSVALHAAAPESLTATLDRIDPILPIDSAARADILTRYREAPSEPVMVRRNIPLEVVSALEEQRPWNPGLVIESDPKRRYPFGPVAAHVVGYVGEITEQELRDRVYSNARSGMLVGRDGIEQQYNDRLQGQDGEKFVEIDALGRTVREAGEGSMLPLPGETIRTSLDIELQQFVDSIFPADSRGGVVALDPTTGGILALYSAPSFDPNQFVGGIDPEVWSRLSQREDFPLFNRVTKGRYPPASPWKLAVAAMALRRGIVDMETRMTIPCRGGMQYYTRYFRCWRVEGHGDLTLLEAIQHSCDVYFYQLGLRLNLTSVLQDGIALGFGEPSGIDLPDERTPIFPPSREYYNQRYGPRGWTDAVTLNLAIGQGENSQTLINMARFYAMLASRRGVAPEPRFVLGGDDGNPRSLGLSEEAVLGLQEALVAVVDEGTAVGAQIANLRVAGKTGTAQNAHGPDHGWFIGFAPADDPEIVVAAIVEFAEHGSRVAPLVTRVIARHLLGPEALAAQFGPRVIETPADSAPEPIPILPDTALVRTPRRDTTRD